MTALCLCGCGLPARPRSKYATRDCCRQYHRREHNRRQRAQWAGVNKTSNLRMVTVIYPEGTLDRMPESHYNLFPPSEWARCGAEVVRK